MSTFKVLMQLPNFRLKVRHWKTSLMIGKLLIKEWLHMIKTTKRIALILIVIVLISFLFVVLTLFYKHSEFAIKCFFTIIKTNLKM